MASLKLHSIPLCWKAHGAMESLGWVELDCRELLSKLNEVEHSRIFLPLTDFAYSPSLDLGKVVLELQYLIDAQLHCVVLDAE